jgi:hypothetical protein
MDARKCTAAAALLSPALLSATPAIPEKSASLAPLWSRDAGTSPSNELFCYRDKTVSHYSAAHVSSVSLMSVMPWCKKHFLINKSSWNS